MRPLTVFFFFFFLGGESSYINCFGNSLYALYQKIKNLFFICDILLIKQNIYTSVVPEVDVNSKETDQQLSEKDEKLRFPLPVRDIEGVQLPYFEVVMDGGTRCDLTGKPRKSRVLYICQPEGRGEIYEFKESSTCEYEVLVLSALLCKHPSYR